MNSYLGRPLRASEFCNRRRTEEEAREAILDLLRRNNHRPIMVGELALYIGPLWSLADTEKLAYRLVAEGKLREATPKEVAAWSHDGFYLVY